LEFISFYFVESTLPNFTIPFKIFAAFKYYDANALQ